MNENNFMKFVKLMTAGVLLLVAFVIGFVIYTVYSFTQKESASVGIIGSADGPTAIYLSGSMSPMYVLLGMVSAVIVIGLISLCISRTKRTHNK